MNRVVFAKGISLRLVGLTLVGLLGGAGCTSSSNPAAPTPVASMSEEGTEASAPASRPPAIRFTSKPATQVEIATVVHIGFTSDDTAAQYRYKLDVPNDWLAGVQLYRNKWSTWGAAANIRYSDFIYEGNYTLTVEAKGKGGTSSASATWRHYFVMPKIMQAAMTIDWKKVQAEKKQSRQFRILAAEYDQMRAAWERQFQGELRALRVTMTPREMLDEVCGTLLEEGSWQLLDAVKFKTPPMVSKVLVLGDLYAIVKQFGISAVMVYRNSRANQAAFTAIAAGWASKGYLDLAKQYESRGL